MKFDSRSIKFIRSIATAGILIYGAYYIYLNREAFSTLQNIGLKYIIIMILFILINIYASAAENAVLFRALGAPINNIESFGLTNISAFFNLILPQGGTIVKAVYLKQKYNIPYSKTPALYLGLFVIYLLIGAGVILIINLLTIIMGKTVPYVLWVAVCGASLSGLMLMVDFPKGVLPKLGRIGTWASNYSDGWRSLRTNKPCLVQACVWQSVIFLSSGVWVTMAYYSLGMKISLLIGTGLSILSSFSNILVIIPGNFGIQEVVYGYFTYLTGTLFAQGVVVSALVRIVLLLITLLLAPISWYYLFHKQDINLKYK